MNTHMQAQQRVWSKMSSGLYMMFLFSLMSGSLQGQILQLDSVVTAKEGDDVSLSCFHPTEQINKVLWYQQPIGQAPLLVTSSYHHSLPFQFHNYFYETKRFNLTRAPGSTNLTIRKVEASDSTVYYCAGAFSNIVRFGAGTFLVLKVGQESNKYTVLRPPVPQRLHPGDSVTLQCSVLTESCSGEHSVYWFRPGSGESPPGIIYTHGNRSDECKKSSETDSSTQSCVYKLPKRNLSLSDAGTYYCAVAACGQILFGNGAELKVDEPRGEILVMICLAALLFISLTVNICLCLTYRNKNTSSPQVTTSDDAVSTVQYNLSDENYAALKFNTKSTKVKRVRHHEETIYSRVTGQYQM